MTLRLSASGEELRERFYSLHTAQDVAALLEVNVKQLYHHIYVLPKPSLYSEFEVPKKTGGTRTIRAPATALKILQRKLNQVLQYVYSPRPAVHGFVLKKSILTNATVHAGRKSILNLDLKEFFPTINFGRVRGLFMNKPYGLDPAVATVLAQICCFDNELPQGAPTSPIVSNMICAKLDGELSHLAKETRCYYTRYADDITFSTNKRSFPSTLAKTDELGRILVGDELTRVITENGFQINPDKVRLQGKEHRQEVTGLTANRFPNVRRLYVRQVRSMLHAWKKFGLEAAEKEFLELHDKKHRGPFRRKPSFKRVVKGKVEFLGMIRGKSDRIYLRLCNELRLIAPELFKEPPSPTETDGATRLRCTIFTEGKSDIKHLKAALSNLGESGYYTNLDFTFVEPTGGKDSNSVLFRDCEAYSKSPKAEPNVFVFDRDDKEYAKEGKVADVGTGYKDWGNNVYSLLLPVPRHRTESPEISMEFLYTDSEIKQVDESGRRLFISNEFDPKSGFHKDPTLRLFCRNKKTLDPRVCVIDNDVYNEERQNVALPKDDFAEHVLRKDKGFENFKFSGFAPLFDLIASIAHKSPSNTSAA